MSRLVHLEARRRALVNRCEEQRLEFAYRLAQINPREQLTAWTRRRAGGVGQSPIAWAAGLAGLVWMLRRRRRGGGSIGMPGVGWITGLAALATRTTTLLRVFAQLRMVYRGFKAAQGFKGERPER
jgi:uncharacterized protein (TIGR03382 family)